MSLVGRIKSWLKIGGVKMGVVPELDKITDHPRIGVAAAEYKRIDRNLAYFTGDFDQVNYKDAYGKPHKRDYTPLNMAQVVCRSLASILVNEQMTIDMKDKAALKFVQDVFDKTDFNKNFERYLESGLALGGLAMRPYLDDGAIKIAYIQAPVFYPLRSNTGDVSEAAIASRSTTTRGQTQIYWTLLEFHRWSKDGAGNSIYNVDNELYRSDIKGHVGTRVDLSMLYPDLADHASTPGYTRPLFVYFKPFGFNNKDITSPLGLSIYDNARPTLRAINDAYDQFHHEILTGQRRIMVPERLTKVSTEGGGETLLFDESQSVYVGINDEMDKANIQDLTSDIRAEEYSATLNELLRKLETQVGLSAGALSPNLASGQKTATEVVSEDSLTYRTRSSHLTNVERAVQELVVSILELAAGYDLYQGHLPNVGDVLVNFDDGVFTDKGAQLDYYSKLVGAGLLSKKRAIAKVLDVSDGEADKILAEIADERPVPAVGGLDAQMFGAGDD